MDIVILLFVVLPLGAVWAIQWLVFHYTKWIGMAVVFVLMLVAHHFYWDRSFEGLEHSDLSGNRHMAAGLGLMIGYYATMIAIGLGTVATATHMWAVRVEK